MMTIANTIARLLVLNFALLNSTHLLDLMEMLTVFVSTMLKNHAFQLQPLVLNVNQYVQAEGQVQALDHLGVQGQDPLGLELPSLQDHQEAEIRDQPEVQAAEAQAAVLVEISLALTNSLAQIVTMANVITIAIPEAYPLAKLNSFPMVHILEALVVCVLALPVEVALETVSTLRHHAKNVRIDVDFMEENKIKFVANSFAFEKTRKIS